tara:strand:+ start:1725 stop:2207 length:483 start_codon:yes stop_codon:yes gene_type:complete
MSCTVCIPGGERCARHRFDEFYFDEASSTLAVGDRRFPAAVSQSGSNSSGMEARGVKLDTEAGVTVSIIWGSLTYSSNHDHPFGRMSLGFEETDALPFVERPTLVEIATWVGGDHGAGMEHGPLAYVSVVEALVVIDRANRGLTSCADDFDGEDWLGEGS